MAFPSWQATIQNDNGDIIPSADMSILLESTGLDATIFSDRLGTTPISVPRTADVNGFFQFYAAPGEYRITASDSGSGFSQTWRYVVLTADSALLPILGAVSQSAGIPTGAIIERGSNANGEYVKFADGTLICTMDNTGTTIPVTSSFGNIFVSSTQSWTYPSVFISAPASSPDGYSTGSAVPIWAGGSTTHGTTSESFFLCAATSEQSGKI